MIHGQHIIFTKFTNAVSVCVIYTTTFYTGLDISVEIVSSIRSFYDSLLINFITLSLIYNLAGTKAPRQLNIS